MTPQSNAADDAKIMYNLTIAKLYAFDLNNHGFFFWNFRTELEPRWDFSRAVAMGWMPPLIRNDSTVDDQMKYVCEVMYSSTEPTRMGRADGQAGVFYLSMLCAVLTLSSMAYLASSRKVWRFGKPDGYEQVVDMTQTHTTENKPVASV